MAPAEILVVEDEPLVAADIAALLRMLGYATAAAHGAEEALQLASQRRFALALVDVRLGGGADGVELGQQLRGRHGMAVVFVTAHSDPATMQRTESIASGYVVKPFTERGLRTAVEIALHKRRLDRALAETEDLALFGSISAAVTSGASAPLTSVLGKLEQARAIAHRLEPDDTIAALERALAEAEMAARAVLDANEVLGRLAPRAAGTTSVEVVDLAQLVDEAVAMLRTPSDLWRALATSYDGTCQVMVSRSAVVAIVRAFVDAHWPWRDMAEASIRIRTITDGVDAVLEMSGPEGRAQARGPCVPGVVRSAIERCDGRVDELHAGGQLVVRITVPAMEAPAASMRQAVPGKLDPSASDGKVLLIWNDEVALRCVARVLAPLPSVAVADARAGLARLAEGTVFDAILCQDDAPGISGHDLWRALRLARPADARRLLLLTRREDPSSGPRAMRLPFQPEALRRAVHQLIVEGAAAR